MSTRKTYWVYILASRKNGTLYIGVTNSLERRTWQHQHPENSPTSSSFAQRYEVDRLVYFEDYGDIALAIAREKQLKAGSRVKKITLIEKVNPEWRDLSEGWFDPSPPP
jgi:putative endonuclease